MAGAGLSFGPSGYEPPVGRVPLGFGEQPTGPQFNDITPGNLQFFQRLEDRPAGGLTLRFGERPFVPGTGPRELVITARNLQFWDGPGYEPPVGRVDFTFGPIIVNALPDTGPETIAATFAGVMPSPVGDFVAGFALATNFAGVMAAPVGDFEIEYDANIDVGPKSLTRQSYQEAARAGSLTRQSYQQGAPSRPLTRSRYEEAGDLQRGTSSSFKRAEALDEISGTAWEEGALLSGIPKTLTTVDAPPVRPPARGITFEQANVANWLNLESLYEEARRLAREYFGPYQEARPLAPCAVKGLYRGRGDSLPAVIRSRYEEAGLPGPGETPPTLPPEPPEPPSPFPAEVELVFCVEADAVPSGSDIRLTFGLRPCEAPPEPPIIIPVRRIYTVTNTAEIVRVSDGTNVTAQSVTMSTSMDDYGWTFKATLPGRSALSLVSGPDGEPVELDVMINGETWRVVVDGWSLNEAWTPNGSGAQISGRSLSSYLAAPYAPRQSYQQGASARLVEQIADDILPLGWGVTWNAQSWLFPADAFAFESKTPMEALAELASTTSAYISSDRTLQQLFVNQRYPAAPWLWSGEAAGATVPRDFILTRSSQKKPGISRDGVFLHGGRVGGVFVKVQRNGTAGANLLPTIVDPNLVEVAPARQRGIYSLGQSQRHAIETHELPVIGALGGVIEPGTIMRVGEGTPFVEDWRGLVIGTTVTASAQRSGNKGVNLRVRQQLAVERHYEA